MTPDSPPTSPSTWKTSATVPSLADRLRSAKSVIITTHAKPDGDAVGSVFALVRTLRALKIQAAALFVGPLPRWMSAIAGDTPYTELAPGAPCTLPSGQPWQQPSTDLVVVVDTGSWTQLAEVKPFLASRADRTLLIDHHLHGDPEVATDRLIITDAASCTQALAPLCSALLNLPVSKLPLPIADMLYLGLATDTGWLRYSSVRPATLRLAADLLDTGVDHTRLYAIIEQQDLPSRWRLLGRALNSLTLHRDGTVATMCLTLEDFAATGADRNDTNGFADMVLTIQTVQVSVVLTAQDPKPGQTQSRATKFSFRSKPGPDAIDVNAIAGKLGGGGHARAAGAKIDLPLDQALARLLESVP